MKFKNLYFILAFASIQTYQIKPASTSIAPKTSSTALVPFKKNPTKEIKDDPSESILLASIPKAPSAPFYGFVPGDRNLHTQAGRNDFNAFVQQVIMHSSQNPKDSFLVESTSLSNQFKENAHKFLDGEVKKIQKAAKDQKLHCNVEHIFTPTIENSPANPYTKPYPILTGFHHDHLKTVEKSGIFAFSDKQEFAHGFYSADIHIDPNNPGSRFRKTFFPANWNRAQVLSCVLLSMKKTTSKPHVTENPKASEMLFTTPTKYKDGSQIVTLKDPALHIGFRVFKDTTKTYLTTAYPTLPPK